LNDLLTALIALAEVICLPFLSSYLTRYISKYNLKKGIKGRDVHKPWKPYIPEGCGLTILILALTSPIPLVLIKDIDPSKILVFILVVGFNGTTGLFDDLFVLPAKLKVIIPAISSIPLIVFSQYTPRPILPFVGSLRITIVYLILLPLAISIAVNVMNMADTHNGILPSTALLIAITLATASFLAYLKGLCDLTGFMLSLITIAVLIGYVPYNLYPAKVFNGDVGSFTLGSILSLIAIYSRTEVLLIIALTPHILNALNILISIGGFKERREIQRRPVVVRDDGFIEVNTDFKAPITLPHIVALNGKIKEIEIYITYVILTFISCIVGLVFYVLALFT